MSDSQDSQSLDKSIMQNEFKNEEQELVEQNQQIKKIQDNEILEREIRQTEDVEIKQKKDEEIIYMNVEQKKEVKVNYELIDQNSIKQNEWCCAVAFNKDQQIVVAGCNENIKVFKHNQGKLDQIQLLSGHKKSVLILRFMSTNNFVSGGGENAIIIWQEIGYHQWNCQQKLIGHLDPIYCLIVNNNDNLIISCSHDCTINFWIKQKQWLCQQTISDHQDQIYSLSLNEQQNKLISCSKDSYILVIEQSTQDQQWYVTQKIKVDQFGYRICFINDNFFIFQPYCQEQMHVYEMDSHRQIYMKTKEIFVNCDSIYCELLFSQQYLKLKCILVIRMVGM
ncbi:unnamed protein product [Paramecium pentaurelia]|uniref:WD40-repeat-containing domain n=1 Tax=Paramecium pentaurelia TaxID=43138 RepID=A0A8S1U5C6_9CILI|nr:unnamed protein product [Paramecium pentaurelia]